MNVTRFLVVPAFAVVSALAAAQSVAAFHERGPERALESGTRPMSSPICLTICRINEPADTAPELWRDDAPDREFRDLDFLEHLATGETSPVLI